MQSTHTYKCPDVTCDAYGANEHTGSLSDSMTSPYTSPSHDIYTGDPTPYPNYTMSSHDRVQSRDAFFFEPPYRSFAPHGSTTYAALDAATPTPHPPLLQFLPYQPEPLPVRTRRSPRKIYVTDVSEKLHVRDGIRHPYARLYNQKERGGKRRRMWNLRLEKHIFTTEELTNMPSPQRRKIYVASLEAHIDRLHEQLLKHSLTPVPNEKLEPYHGLHPKTAKSMVSGLQYDASEMNVKLLELERTNMEMQRSLDKMCAGSSRHSSYYYIPDAFR